MTVHDGVIEGSRITFLLSGHMSRGSTPLLELLIRRSRKLGFSVTLDLERVTVVEREAATQLSIWQSEGVTVSGAPELLRQHARPVPSDADLAPDYLAEGSRLGIISLSSAAGVDLGEPRAVPKLGRCHWQTLFGIFNRRKPPWHGRC